MLRHLPQGRTLHVVDVENLAGGSSASEAEVAVALERYERVVRFGPDDHRVVACGKSLVFPVVDRWGGSLVRLARGIDGADRILLDAAAPEYVVRHYRRVVVASGDHAFVDLVVELDRRGVEVTVVSRRDALSRRLEAVAPVVWFVEDVAAAAA
jgi:hypothetical protein